MSFNDKSPEKNDIHIVMNRETIINLIEDLQNLPQAYIVIHRGQLINELIRNSSDLMNIKYHYNSRIIYKTVQSSQPIQFIQPVIQTQPIQPIQSASKLTQSINSAFQPFAEMKRSKSVEDRKLFSPKPVKPSLHITITDVDGTTITTNPITTNPISISSSPSTKRPKLSSAGFIMDETPTKRTMWE